MCVREQHVRTAGPAFYFAFTFKHALYIDIFGVVAGFVLQDSSIKVQRMATVGAAPTDCNLFVSLLTAHILSSVSLMMDDDVPASSFARRPSA